MCQSPYCRNASPWDHISPSEVSQSTATSRRAEDNLPDPMDLVPDAMKLQQTSARLRKLQREKSNALRRERRAKSNMQALLEQLKKHLINEDLKQKLECYSDLPVHLLSRQGVEYAKAQRDFALTLHLHGPRAYQYLRETLHIHLPHPSSLQSYCA